MTNEGRNGGKLPDLATAVGGKGADGKFYYLSVASDGSIAVTPAAGGATAANQTTQITAEQAILATAGATNGAAVITDANGTLQQYLRGLVKLLITKISVFALPTQGAPTDRSGSITLGGTSQQLAAANATRVYIEIQNISDETQYINFGAAATTDTDSFKLVAGASYVNPASFCPTGTINIIGATTGKKFVAKEG